MGRNLFEEFKRFEGQPVRIFTDDGRIHTGIDIMPIEDAVRIVDRCGRLNFIKFCHIAAVEEPQMMLRRRPCRDDRDDDDDDDDDDDCDCGCDCDCD